MAPFEGKRISCKTCTSLISCRVENKISFLMPLKAANRAPYLASRRGVGVLGLMGRRSTKGPVMTKMKAGSLRRAVTGVHLLRSRNISIFLIIIPCCGGPPRRNVCRCFGTITRSARGPVLLCGIPNHANTGLRTRAALHLTRVGGVVKVGRTSDGENRVLGVVTNHPRNFLILDNGSSRACPLVGRKTSKIVDITSGITPRPITGLTRTVLRNGIRGTTNLRRGLSPLFHGYFIRDGPVPTGTTLTTVNVVRGRLHLPLMPSVRGACSLVIGAVESLKLL